MNREPRRWRRRFANYGRALTLLREAVDAMIKAEEGGSGLSQLEKEGTIQRFEYTFELAWNVLKDYLESQGVVFPEVTPRTVLRKAFEANVIADGDVWMSALDARNKMSHTYAFEEFEKVVQDIRKSYLPVMDGLHAYLLDRTSDDD